MAPSTRFTGVFDGNGHTIKNLYINDTNRSYCGLFGAIGKGGKIQNLHLKAADVCGSRGVGMLAGDIFETTISNCSAEGYAQDFGMAVGGLVGVTRNSIITKCNVQGTVDYHSYGGGLVGSVEGTIALEECSTSVTLNLRNAQDRDKYTVAGGGLVGCIGEGGGMIHKCQVVVSMDTNGMAGGLVGRANIGYQNRDEKRPFSLSECTATVSMHGAWYGGGLVGDMDFGTVTHCRTTGKIFGTNGCFLGGLIGQYNTGRVEACESDLTIDCEKGESVGGLIGVTVSSVTLTQSKASGAISAGDAHAGGLVGETKMDRIGVKAIVEHCSASGNVSGADAVGGLIGQCQDGCVIACIATGNVTAGVRNAGGLIGACTRVAVVGGSNPSRASIVSSSASGNVISKIESAGGLIGHCDGFDRIEGCHLSGEVQATRDTAGGLIGSLSLRGGTLSRCSASGKVKSPRYAGGLLGGAGSGIISDCFVSANVYVEDLENYIPWGAPLVSNAHDVRIERCLAVGKVICNNKYIEINKKIDPNKSYIPGGLAGGGIDWADFRDSYWNAEITGQATFAVAPRWDRGGMGIPSTPCPTEATAEVKAKGLSTAELFCKATYVNWDFEKVWTIEDGKGYPALRPFVPVSVAAQSK
ncbi:TPA: hypothetical protein DDW35_02850 [Candidatus Sumerlaeota bacterium]|nr:hypothetical protein [Candidatus Sumerlaeota bacterium]